MVYYGEIAHKSATNERLSWLIINIILWNTSMHGIQYIYEGEKSFPEEENKILTSVIMWLYNQSIYIMKLKF